MRRCIHSSRLYQTIRMYRIHLTSHLRRYVLMFHFRHCIRSNYSIHLFLMRLRFHFHRMCLTILIRLILRCTPMFQSDHCIHSIR